MFTSGKHQGNTCSVLYIFMELVILLQVEDSGLYLTVRVHDMGLTLQWDRGNKVYLRLTPRSAFLCSIVPS